METESKLVVLRVRGQKGMGRNCLMGLEYYLGVIQIFGNRTKVAVT